MSKKSERILMKAVRQALHIHTLPCNSYIAEERAIRNIHEKRLLLNEMMESGYR